MNFIKTNRYQRLRSGIMLTVLLTLSLSASHAQKASTESILQSFVESYKNDPMAMNVTFGIAVEDDWWYVTCKRQQEGYAVGKNDQFTFHSYGPHDVQLHKGKLPRPGWYFNVAIV